MPTHPRSILERLNTYTHDLLKSRYTGVVFDANQLYVAHIVQSGNRTHINSLENSFLSQDSNHERENVKPLYMGEPPPQKKKITSLACGLPGTKTLTKTLHTELTKPKEIQEALSFQLEPFLPYSIDTCLIDKIILEKGNAETKLLAFSILKNDVQEQLKITTEQIKEPEYAVPKAVALARFSNRILKPASRILIDLGYDETMIVLMHEQMIYGARTIANSLASRLDKEENADDGAHIKQFSNEILHAIYSFQTTYPNAQQLPVTFTGPVESDSYLLSLLGKLLGVNVETHTLLSKEISLQSGIAREAIFSYAIPIGLALCAAMKKNDALCINFRKEEMAFPYKWTRWKSPLAIYYSFMIILSSLLYIYLESDLQEKQNYLTASVNQIATASEINIGPALATTYDLGEKLQTIRNELQKPGDELPLYPNIPRVADVLAFLCSHPKVLLDQNDPAKTIQLESFTYTLVKRPEKGRLKEHYQVRIDLEFTAPNSTTAREFHEALISPNQIIDSKEEVKWSMQKGHFKTSFFLQDKTQYPGGGPS